QRRDIERGEEFANVRVGEHGPGGQPVLSRGRLAEQLQAAVDLLGREARDELGPDEELPALLRQKLVQRRWERLVGDRAGEEYQRGHAFRMADGIADGGMTGPGGADQDEAAEAHVVRHGFEVPGEALHAHGRYSALGQPLAAVVEGHQAEARRKLPQELGATGHEQLVLPVDLDVAPGDRGKQQRRTLAAHGQRHVVAIAGPGVLDGWRVHDWDYALRQAVVFGVDGG